MRCPLPLLAALCATALLAAPAARGQDAPPAANLLSNGGFENGFHTVDNLWDGVDSDGYLCGFRFSAQVVSDRGTINTLAMPPSVALVDLNGNGKPGLLVADPSGYFRYYPNRGTTAAPHFTSAELVPIFLSTALKPRDKTWAPALYDTFRFCPRFAAADWRHSGVLDLIVGNYYGETFFLPNLGTATRPVFRQPTGPNGIASARLSTGDRNPFWGNLFAPAAFDPEHRGVPDLLLGEGTYSANSIHLLHNVSNGGTPKFTDGQHTSIAYGDGREQLIPTVVDYDGDGNPDLLVADRTGEVGVYLNPGKSAPPGTEFKRVSTLSVGGHSKLPGLPSIYAADFNGDGLFDLIIGLSTGRIGVALNIGTKTAPKFGPIEELKGEDRLGRNVNLPDSWNVSTFPEYGNALAYFCVVDAKDDPDSQPPEGTHCLKAGYWPLPGETFQMPPEGLPSTQRHFVLSRSSLTLNNNKAYALSFRVKGTGIEKANYHFVSEYKGPAEMGKIERGERGEVAKGSMINETVEIGEDFHPSTGWGTAGGTLNIRYRTPALRDRPTMTGSLYIDFWASNMSSVIYFDDFKLVPQQ